MAYEFLRKLFGTPAEGEQPKAMTYAELEAAIDATNDIQVVDLKAGGYVSKDKFDAKITELSGVKQQLSDAHAQIQSFKDKGADAEAISRKVSEWETKYNTDTQALRDQLAQQERTHAEDMFLSGYEFTSTPARQGVLDAFRAQKFTLEDGTFKGGKEYIDSLMKQDDYKGAFVVKEEPPADQPPQNQGQQQAGRFGQQPPRFAQSATGNTSQNGTANPFLNGLGVTRLRQPPAPINQQK